MRWLLCLACLPVFAAAWGAGIWIGKKSPRASLVAAVACVLALGVRVVFRYFPGLELELLPFDAYAVLRPWWAVPFAMIPLGIGATHMSTPFARKGVGLFGVLLIFVCAHRLVVTALFDPATLTGAVHPRTGVCEQTTDYTCGAAAAATLLAHYGIEADEREMAERCWTNALTGTDEACVARGLRQKLEGTGKQVAIRGATFEELAARTEPAMVTIRFGVLVDHWVVVREVLPEGVVRVADPLQGLRLFPKEEFLADWRGSVVVIE